MPPKRRIPRNGDDRFVFKSASRVNYGVGQSDNPRGAPFASQPTWLSGDSNTRMSNAFLDGALRTTAETALEYFPRTTPFTGTIGREMRDTLEQDRRMKERIVKADVSKLKLSKAQYESFINLDADAWRVGVENQLNSVLRSKKASYSETKKFIEKDFRFTLLDDATQGLREALGLPKPTPFSKEQCALLYKRVVEMDSTLVTAPLSTFYQFFSCVGLYDAFRDLFRAKMAEFGIVGAVALTTMSKTVLRWLIQIAKRLYEACTDYGLPIPDDLANMADGQPPPPPAPGGGGAGGSGGAGGDVGGGGGASGGGAGGGGAGGDAPGDGGAPTPSPITNTASPELSMTSDANVVPTTQPSTTIAPIAPSGGHTLAPVAPTASPAMEGDNVVKSAYSPYLLHSIEFLLCVNAVAYGAFRMLDSVRGYVKVEPRIEQVAETALVRARGHVNVIPGFLAQNSPILFWTSNLVNTLLASVGTWLDVERRFSEWIRYVTTRQVENEERGRPLFEGVVVAELPVADRLFQLASLYTRGDTPAHLRVSLQEAIQYLRDQLAQAQPADVARPNAEEEAMREIRENRDETRVRDDSEVAQRYDQFKTLDTQFNYKQRLPPPFNMEPKMRAIMDAFVNFANANGNRYLTNVGVDLLEVAEKIYDFASSRFFRIFTIAGPEHENKNGVTVPQNLETIDSRFISKLLTFRNDQYVREFATKHNLFTRSYYAFLLNIIALATDYRQKSSEYTGPMGGGMVRP